MSVYILGKLETEALAKAKAWAGAKVWVEEGVEVLLPSLEVLSINSFLPIAAKL